MKKLLNNIIALIMIFSLIILISCNKENKFKDSCHYYRAINGRDTADLSITMADHYFKGEFKIRYGNKAIMDSGYVRGKIAGDTLIGNYYYKSYGGLGESAPISLLMRNKKLIFGSGVVTNWMGFNYFNAEVPIDYESPKFIFKKVKKMVK
jgi:hypothetical protein